MEEWRVVRGFPGYEASSWGRVRSKKRRNVKNPSDLQSGYHVMCLREAGKQFNVKVHRIVAAAFIPQFDIHDASQEIDHIDQDKANNVPTNLRIADRVQQSNNRDHTNASRGKRYIVEKVDKRTGEVVAVYESVNEAARAIGHPGGAGNICNVINGKNKSAYGFVWRYAEPDLSDLPGEEWVAFEDVYVSNKGRVKRAMGETGYRIQEVTAHSKKNGYPTTMIRGTDWPVHKLVAHVFLGATAEDRIHLKDGNRMNPSSDNLEVATRGEIAKAAEERGRKRYRIGVTQYDADGTLVCEYESAAAASRATGIDSSHIGKCARGVFPTAGGSVWHRTN